MNAVAIECISRRYAALIELVPLRPIRTKADYNRAVQVLNDLLDAGGADEKDPLAGLVEALGGFIAEYENRSLPQPDVSGADMVKFFMRQHDLGQGDLPEIGSQGVVSEVLGGKRQLNLRQVKALAQRFRVEPTAFM